MPLAISFKRRWHHTSLAFVVLSAASTTIRGFHTPFQNHQNAIAVRPCTRLSTSLSTPTGGSISHHGDDERKGSEITSSNIRLVAMNNVVETNEFHRHLQKATQQIKSMKSIANALDDEVKRLEIRFYKLSEADSPQCRYPASGHTYQGPTFRPDARCYAMVTNAYAKAGLGDAGAQLAEDAAKRYEDYFGVEANAYIRKGVVKAWIQAGNLSKAESWLQRIEDRFQMTGQQDDAPDITIYKMFLEALATSSGVYRRKAGDISLEILEKMRRLFLLEEDPSFLPDRATYKTVMKCQQNAYQGRDRGMLALRKIDQVYRQQEKDYENFGRPLAIRPCVDSVLPVCEAASRCHGSMEAITVAEKYLQNFQERYDRTKDPEFRPVESMYTWLLSSYARVSAKHASQCSKKAGEMLEIMTQNKMLPSKYALTAAMAAKANEKSEASLREAEELMRRMDSPDRIAYQSLIRGLCRFGDASRADLLLAELEEKWGASVMTIGVCIDAYSKTKGKELDLPIERAEYLLEWLMRNYREGLVGPHEAHVNTWVFEDVARLWSRSRKPNSGDRIVKLIEAMEKLHQEVPGLFQPTEDIYIIAIDAYAGSGLPDAGSKAIKLLQKRRNLAIEGTLEEPNIRVLASVLSSVTRSSHEDTVQVAYEIYQEILNKFKLGDRSAKIDSRTLTSLLSAVLNSSDKRAVSLGLDILNTATTFGRNYCRDLTPNTIVFNCALDGLARQRATEEAWEVFGTMKQLAGEGFQTSPDATSYSCIARALREIWTPNSVANLDSILEEVSKGWKKGIIPADIQLFNTILTGYSRAAKSDQEAVIRADQLLLELEKDDDGGLSPDLATYRIVLRAHANSKEIKTSHLGEEIFDRAKERAEKGLIEQLDRDVYSSMLTIYTRSKQEDYLAKAEALLDEMESKQRNGARKASPDVRAYNSMISAYACSSVGDKVGLASAMFDRMKLSSDKGDKTCIPNLQSYNWIILAAARSHSDSSQSVRESFDCALEKFKFLHSSEAPYGPDGATYEFFVRACINLLPSGDVRTNLVRKAFYLARKHGMVTPRLLKRVHCLVPEVEDSLEMVKTSFSKESEDSRVGLIPRHWCMGIPENKRKFRVDLGECRLIDPYELNY